MVLGVVTPVVRVITADVIRVGIVRGGIGPSRFQQQDSFRRVPRILRRRSRRRTCGPRWKVLAWKAFSDRPCPTHRAIAEATWPMRVAKGIPNAA